MLLTAALTGVRHGELLALPWTDLDLEEGKVTIRRSVSWAKAPNGLEGNRLCRDAVAAPEKGVSRPDFKFTRPKTRAGLRTIPLAVELVSSLKRWKAQVPAKRPWARVSERRRQPLHRKSVLNALHRNAAPRKAPRARRQGAASHVRLAARRGWPSGDRRSSTSWAKPTSGHAPSLSHWFKRTEGRASKTLRRRSSAQQRAKSGKGLDHSADTKAASRRNAVEVSPATGWPVLGSRHAPTRVKPKGAPRPVDRSELRTARSTHGAPGGTETLFFWPSKAEAQLTSEIGRAMPGRPYGKKSKRDGQLGLTLTMMALGKKAKEVASNSGARIA